MCHQKHPISPWGEWVRASIWLKTHLPCAAAAAQTYDQQPWGWGQGWTLTVLAPTSLTNPLQLRPCQTRGTDLPGLGSGWPVGMGAVGPPGVPSVLTNSLWPWGEPTWVGTGPGPELPQGHAPAPTATYQHCPSGTGTPPFPQGPSREPCQEMASALPIPWLPCWQDEGQSQSALSTT